MKKYNDNITLKSINNKIDYIIEKRINPEDCVLFSKNMESGEFKFLEEKYITNQEENHNLFFLVNGYLEGKRSLSKLRKIYALGFDIDTLKEGMSDEEFYKRLEEIEEFYGLKPHIINKTLGGYHIYFLLEKTPYIPFKKDFEKIYNTLNKDLGGDDDFSWKIGVLKVVGGYDFRRKGWIINIKNEFHNSYKITDFNKIIGGDIFKKYEKVNFAEEFKKIEIEELNLKKKKNAYIYKVNDIPFSILLEKLEKENFKILIVNNRIIIDGNEGHGKALCYYVDEDRVIDFNRNGRKNKGEQSRGSNYGFLNYLFSLKEQNKDKIKEKIRNFIGLNFNIYYRNQDSYINTNKLIYNEFLNSKISFNEKDKNFLLENGVINEKSELTNTSKFLLLNLLKISECDMTGFFKNKTIYDLLKPSSLTQSNIQKQNIKYKTILLGLSKIYKNIYEKSKNDDKIKVFLVSNLIEENYRIFFHLLKNYFKLNRFEKNVYRGIFIGFINNQKLNIDKLDLYFYLYNSIINNIEELRYDILLTLFGGKTYLINKSLAKKNLLNDLTVFKSLISTKSIKIDFGKEKIILKKYKK